MLQLCDVLLDPEDRWLLDAFTWCTPPSSRYVIGYVPNSDNTMMFLHHCILGKPLPGIVIDHRNGNGLDNRRSNLRMVSYACNRDNSILNKNNSTGYRGVSFNKNAGKYQASIQLNGKRIHLGYFMDAAGASAIFEKTREEHYVSKF